MVYPSDIRNSPLKRLIVWSVVVPLVAALLLTCVVSLSVVVISFPSWVFHVEETMINLERENIAKLAIDKAKYSSEYLEGIANDVRMMQAFATDIFADSALNETYIVPRAYSGVSTNYYYDTNVLRDYPPFCYYSASFYPVREQATRWPYHDMVTRDSLLFKQSAVLQVALTVLRDRDYISVYAGIEPDEVITEPLYMLYPYSNMDAYYGYSGYCHPEGTAPHGGQNVLSCNTEYSGTCGYDPRCRPWYGDAINAQTRGEVIFSAPYEVYTLHYLSLYAHCTVYVYIMYYLSINRTLSSYLK